MSIGLALLFWIAVGLILIIRGLSRWIGPPVLGVLDALAWIVAGMVVILVQGIP